MNSVQFIAIAIRRSTSAASSELKASEQKELGHIPVAELVAHAAKQYLKDNVCGNFDNIERRAAAFIVSSTTALAPKHVVAQAGFPLER